MLRGAKGVRSGLLMAANVAYGSPADVVGLLGRSPLFPRKQTSAAEAAKSASGHNRTHAPQQNYSITSTACASSVGGTVRPSALAVFMLITNSNLVGCSTGRSEGLVPLRILST
jgi:hypothetical protein